MIQHCRIIILGALLIFACRPLERQSERNKMKVYFEYSGGLLQRSAPRTATIDSETLSSEEADRLRDMVNTADFFNLPSVIKAKTPGGDQYVYKVTVETQNQKHTVEREERAIPQTLRPLIDWLKAAEGKGKGSK